MKKKILLLIVSLTLSSACSSTTSKSPTVKIAQLDTTTATPVPSATETFLPPTWTPTQTLAATGTFTITPSPTVTISPTKMATSTSQPGQADIPLDITLASTTIQLSDLPDSFEVVEIDQSRMQYLPLQEEGIAAMEVAFYTNEHNGGSVLSATFMFVDSAAQAIFDYSIDEIDVIMQQKMDELGFTEMGFEVGVEVIPDFPPIGDKSVAIELEVGFNLIVTRTKIALFREDHYGGAVMIVPSITEPDSVDLSELALLQYSRMLAILGGDS